MSQIFQPLLGKDITVSIQMQSVDADGVLTNSGSAVTFVGRMEEVSGGRTETTLEEVVPMDCFPENAVPIGEITRYSISEIMMALKSAATGSTKGNKLLYIVENCRYFIMTLTAKDHAASPAAVFTEVVLCMWTVYDPTFRRGNAKGRMEFQTVAKFDSSGVYEANPAVTLAT